MHKTTSNTNLFSQFNATKPSQVGHSMYPWLGGWRGEIYQGAGAVWALVVKASAAGDLHQYLAIVPAHIATRADSIEFDPYNDAYYAQAMLDLAKDALTEAEKHQQTGQKKVHAGGLDLDS